MNSTLKATALCLVALAGCTNAAQDNPDELAIDPDIKGDVPRRAQFFGELDDGRPGVFEIGARQYFAYFFAARAGAKLDLEVERSGTSPDFDTTLAVYGPRDQTMKFGRSIAHDDDSGYGKLSKVTGLVTRQQGIYAVIVAGQATHTREGFFLTLTCRSAGGCLPAGYVDMQEFGQSDALEPAVTALCGSTPLDSCMFSATVGTVFGASDPAARLAAWAEDQWESGRGYESLRPHEGPLNAAQIDAIAARLALTTATLRANVRATRDTTVYAVDATRHGVDLTLYFFETTHVTGDLDFVVLTLPNDVAGH